MITRLSPFVYTQAWNTWVDGRLMMLWRRSRVEVDEGSAAFACARLRVLSPNMAPLSHWTTYLSPEGYSNSDWLWTSNVSLYLPCCWSHKYSKRSLAIWHMIWTPFSAAYAQSEQPPNDPSTIVIYWSWGISFSPQRGWSGGSSGEAEIKPRCQRCSIAIAIAFECLTELDIRTSA